MTSDHDDVRKRFREAVNMAATELDAFLKTAESRKVGQKHGGGDESIGHESGRKIVALLKKKASELNSDDYSHMKKVIGYVARHSVQGGPDTDKEHSYWRYSLMNWGHDPLK